jgi:hypothetical protein
MKNNGCPQLLPKSAGGLGSSAGCAGKNKVRRDRSPFYVNWAKEFANFLPDKPSPNNNMVQVPREHPASFFLLWQNVIKKGYPRQDIENCP